MSSDPSLPGSGLSGPGAEPTPAVQRRRFLRGTFAAPAVLTVVSGRAFAQASNARCVANAVQTGTMLPNPGDTFLRVQLFVLERQGKTARYYVFGGDLAGYPRTSSFPLASNQYQLFDLGSNQLQTTVSTGVPSYNSSTGSWQRSTKYAAMRFDASGTLVGIGTPSSTTNGLAGAALSTACWSSFRGLA